MRQKNTYYRLWAIIVLLFFISGCGAIFNQPMKTKPAELGTVTVSEKRLSQLPPPKEQIMAAVYNFRDKTGQYKLTETGGSWSTAITQGATSILINALEESGWFVPIEREGLGNLLNERKIIRSSRAHYSGNEASSLPPLLFAGIMLEGGIISYDHNVQTGGVGVRYFGAGSSGEYRQDRVTVYLRAVSTKNGKILKTVNATKTVLSQKIDAGIFRYVKFKRLLEAETGITYNEPTEIAVKEAVEKAVESLIIEGLFDNLWDLKNSEDINSDIIQSYVQDKANIERADLFGMTDKSRSYRYSLRLESGATQYTGDYAHPMNRPQLDINFGYDISEHFMPYVNFGKSYLAAKNNFFEGYNFLNLGFMYRFTPQKPYTAYLVGGFGGSIQSYKAIYKVKVPENINTVFPQINGGLGFEYLLGVNRRWGIHSALKVNYFLNDKADDIVHGYLNDYYWEGKLGVSYYF